MTETTAPLRDFPMTDTGRRMGRPPLAIGSKTITTAVRLTQELMQRIEAVAGPNRMAAFIREAVEEKLARDEGQEPAAPRSTRNPNPTDP